MAYPHGMQERRPVSLGVCLEREYLMLCTGSPWSASGTRGTRVDALARIARAALTAYQTAHLLFEDGTLLTLTPDFLGKGRPWGDYVQEASEWRFQRTLEDLLRGRPCQGAKLREPEPLKKRLRTLFTDRKNKARFRLVLALHEDGCPLWSAMHGPRVEPDHPSSAIASSLEPASRVCVVCGGVRDVSEEEETAIQHAALELNIPYQSVSFGHTPELTSKCIKALEAADSVGFLAEALKTCESLGWQPTPQSQAGNSRRSPFHVVAVLDVPLMDFVTRPEAANLLVDIFRGSHHSYGKAALSLLDPEGAALTIHNSDMEYILREKGALVGLRGLLRRTRKSGLKQLLAKEHNRFCRKGNGRILALHADESSEPLAISGYSLEQTPASASDTVAVILVFNVTPELADTIKDVCCQAGVFVRAAVGPFSMGLALLSMLHNEGLLAGCILKSAGTLFGEQGTTQKQRSEDVGRLSPLDSEMDCASKGAKLNATDGAPVLHTGRTQEQAKARTTRQRRRGFSGQYKECAVPVQNGTIATIPKADDAGTKQAVQNGTVATIPKADDAGTKQAEVAHRDVKAETMLHDPQKAVGTAANSDFFYVGMIKVQLQRNLFSCGSSDVFLPT